MKIYCSLSMVLVCVLATASWGQSLTEHRDRGAVMGALLGGLTGAAIGDHNGEALAGAAIGAGVGAITGGAIGDSVDNDIARQQVYQQRQYQAAMAQAVSVDSAIAMTHAGLSPNVIATQIRTCGVAYRPQTEDLLRLGQAGVSDVVIAAMQTAPLATSPAPAPVYRRPTVIEERVYVTPVYPRPYPVYRPVPGYYRPPHGHHHPSNGVHWSFSLGH